MLSLSGSPPPMRGKDCKAWFSAKLSQDHPRLCGEKHQTPADQSARQGSPPPMRGKVLIPTGMKLRIRITPAYAGKSPAWFPLSGSDWDHPRLCGEKQMPMCGCSAAIGSPPPMRGKVLIPTGMKLRIRITPAYAGKSPAWFPLSGSDWDHPRLCGEKYQNPEV